MPGLVGLRLQLEFVHGQAATLAGGADEALVEGDIGAQAGDFLVTLGQRGLQVAVGVTADLVRARQRGDPLLQLLDLFFLGLELMRAGRLSAAGQDLPQAPAAEGDQQRQQGDGRVEPEPPAGRRGR